MQRDYELEEWKNRAQSLKKKLWALIILLFILATISLVFFVVTTPQMTPTNHQASPVATSTTIKPAPSELKPLTTPETGTVNILPSTINITAFEAQYKKPDGCDNPASMKMMVECSNHYIREKNKFLASRAQ